MLVSTSGSSSRSFTNNKSVLKRKITSTQNGSKEKKKRKKEKEKKKKITKTVHKEWLKYKQEEENLSFIYLGLTIIILI